MALPWQKRSMISGVSLFPFLSVLVCLMGVLCVLIVTASLTSSLDSETSVVPDAPSQDAREQASATADSLARRVHLNEELLEELLARLREMTGESRELRSRLARTDSLRAVRTEMEAELAALMARITALAQTVEEAERRQPRTTAAMVVVPEALRGQQKYNPLFVECRQDGLLILPTGKILPATNLSESAELRNLLNQIKSSKKWCLFMLVRRGGVKTFNDVNSSTL